MPIAFYAPLKPPHHQVPSGDRQMGRLLLLALERAGFEPSLASSLRAYLPKGDCGLAELKGAAEAEVRRLLSAYRSAEQPTPRLWFTYHSYYKSPDLIGPAVAQSLGIPYVTAEASHAPKRASGPWAHAHALNQEALAAARLNFCFTERDQAGLLNLLGNDRLTTRLHPFVDVTTIPQRASWTTSAQSAVRLLTVAMMRADVKLQSYQMLAEALRGLEHLNWTLDIIGDGDARPDVEHAFAPLPQTRLTWHGRQDPQDVGAAYGHADLFVWPGFGEAYGMAFLEAQAGGLAVIAQNTKGIPSVVEHGKTGLLTPENDVAAFQNAISSLLEDRARLAQLGKAASHFVREERSVDTAAAKLKDALEPLL